VAIDFTRMQQVLGHLSLRQKDARVVRAAQQQAAVTAPPYVRAVAVHEATTRWVGRVGLCLLLSLGGLVGYQQYHIRELGAQLRQKEFLVVPGAADFVPVRANMIPDRVVVEFAAYFVSQMVSVTDSNIERRYQAMGRFLEPALAGKLDQELKRKAAVLRSLHGAEVFEPMGEPVVQRKTVEGKATFEAKVRGRVARYALGQALDSSIEIVTVTFRPRSSLGAEEPWIFEVVELARRTETEQLQFERTQQVVAAENDEDAGNRLGGRR
jgi:hypothetical protein